MSFVAVLPSIHPPYTWTCLQSMHPAFRAHTHSKWGGMPSHETFTTTFDSGRSLSYWPERVAA